ncbi:MAG: hypothetical protein KBF45_11035 [Cyclobacteriaceae bacterium]|jgi:hypothetical protein|nr:hypothetical protein [Cyclobacteriaceae bacterium]
MKTFALRCTILIVISLYSSFMTVEAKSKPKELSTPFSNHAANYETDGHYWTVLVVATMLKIRDAKVVAFNAEYPDNVINQDGYTVRGRLTFLLPGPQKKVHALTGGDPEIEKTKSLHMLQEATDARSIGIASHRLGDSYSHINDRTGRMYPHVLGHVFRWQKPDKIRSNAKRYLAYVYALVKGMGGPEAKIDMTVFNYIAEHNLSSEENSAILKAEYNLLNGSPAFNVGKGQINLVQKYLTERMINNNRSYLTYSNTDEKKRTTITIILTSSNYLGQNIRLEEADLIKKQGETKIIH